MKVDWGLGLMTAMKVKRPNSWAWMGKKSALAGETRSV
jgi:hypothetical protein